MYNPSFLLHKKVYFQETLIYNLQQVVRFYNHKITCSVEQKILCFYILLLNYQYLFLTQYQFPLYLLDLLIAKFLAIKQAHILR